MRAHAIRAKTRRKFRATTQSHHNLPVAENTSQATGLVLDRGFTVNTPDTAWVGDITYIGTQEGWYISRCSWISSHAKSLAWRSQTA